ncbi:MAG TPA: phage/plasmid primase, P4 family [Pseudonocardia sp.]
MSPPFLTTDPDRLAAEIDRLYYDEQCDVLAIASNLGIRQDQVIAVLDADDPGEQQSASPQDTPTPPPRSPDEPPPAEPPPAEPPPVGCAPGAERHHGQLRFAERFTRAYGDQFLHVHGIGWHAYDGTRWAPCLDGAETRAVLSLIKGAFRQLADLDRDDRTDLLRDITKVESASGVHGVLALARNMHPCTLAADALDANAHLLNTCTGTVNITTGAVSDPRPADYLSKVTGAKFDPHTRSELFEEFLATIQPDPQMRAFLARQLGSSLLGSVREHVLFLWYGTGANGKGTLRDAVRHALGDYAVEVPADILLVNKYGQQAMAPERMRLKGTRVAFCSEIEEGARLDEATMKKLTGGDPVNAKLLYRNPIEFEPSHILFMLTNHLPQVKGDDPATWRRIHAVPFGVVVAEGERDGELPEKLKGESEAILAWVWRGWLDYQRNGLNPPDAVRQATRQYQLDSDVVARFLADESVVCRGHGSESSARLYRAFTDWIRAQGEDVAMTNKAFTKALEIREHHRVKTSAGARWTGITLVSEQYQSHPGAQC